MSTYVEILWKYILPAMTPIETRLGIMCIEEREYILQEFLTNKAPEWDDLTGRFYH